MYCEIWVNTSAFSHGASRIPAVVAGADSIGVLGEPAGVFGNRQVVLVVDEAVVGTGYVDRATALLDHVDDVHLHVVPPHEPTAASVDAAASVVRRAAAATVVGIGGGTALDTAKQAAVVAGGVAGVEHYALGARPLPAGQPIVAVPTTAGTGAEVTRTCVLTDGQGRKVWTWGEELVPRLVVLDPAAVATMPAHVAAASGLDALVHAVEAVTGRRTTPLVAAPALHAIRLIREHLPAGACSAEVDARHAMQHAALLAGLAIDAGGTGIAHAIGHALGALAGVPHGVAVAVGLAAALPWNLDGAAGAFEPVTGALGCRTGGLPDVYAGLLVAAGFPAAVRRVGELPVDAPDLVAAMAADENAPMCVNNCRVADETARAALAASTLRVWEELRAA
jgi:alcohol dehydrogenase class IV